jgi:hypothetical protein
MAKRKLIRDKTLYDTGKPDLIFPEAVASSPQIYHDNFKTDLREVPRTNSEPTKFSVRRIMEMATKVRRVVSAGRFAGYYHRKQPKLFGASFAKFVNDHMFATFDFNSEASPSSINRHAILHGGIFDYASEAKAVQYRPSVAPPFHS